MAEIAIPPKGRCRYFFEDDLQEAFDFKSLIKNKNVAILAGIPVKIDKVLYDVTGTMVFGLSGTIVIHGVKLRGVWDSLGNIVDFERLYKFYSPSRGLTEIFDGMPTKMFSLVQAKSVEELNDDTH